MSCGVYLITFKGSSSSYVGASNNMSKRFNVHLSSARKGKHSNSEFQKLFDQLGESSIEFTLLQKCSKSELSVVESYWITRLQPNLNKLSAGHGLGDKPPCSDERKAKIARALTGIVRTQETKRRISEKRKHQVSPACKTWRIVDIDGVESEIFNLRSWCATQGISYKNAFYHAKKGTPINGVFIYAT